MTETQSRFSVALIIAIEKENKKKKKKMLPKE